MAWIEITEADVLTVLSGPELAAYRAAATADGQADPVQPTIDKVTDEIRGYVGACAANTLGASGIPQKLVATALDIIAVRLPNRVGKSPKTGREQLYKDALDRLKMVANCKFDIEEPEEATEEESSNPAGRPSIATNRTKKFDRCSQDGI